MNPKINSLLQDYKRGGINRRDFLRKLTIYAGSTAAAAALLPLLDESQWMPLAITPPRKIR